MLVFAEFVAIKAVGDFAKRCGQREHGDLNHVVPLRVVIDPVERIGIDNIFRVMRHNHVETHAMLFFVEQHALINPVEAIGF